ncbi:MAG: AAA family ATPase [Clostridia bacterium]|nr:AAA family ATPase [Clostridia bacterium]
MGNTQRVLTSYNDIKEKAIDWFWYPYVAIGKITLLQGDPGDGKSTMILNLLASLSKGYVLPDGADSQGYRRAIYQCSEDDVADTIKPRLEKAGANCANIAFINEDMCGEITLDDDRLRQAIVDFRPRVVVIDPIQSYIGNPSDLLVAGKLRKAIRKIGLWASSYDCAIILISHLNKNEGTKSLYRNLGSIDLVAAARSVLQVERDPEIPSRRIVRQIKNNLGPIGNDLCFEIHPESGFRWILNKLDSTTSSIMTENPLKELPKTKQELATTVLKSLLSNGPVESKTVQNTLSRYKIGNKTMQNVKTLLGIKSYRKMRKWYWYFPSQVDDQSAG